MMSKVKKAVKDPQRIIARLEASLAKVWSAREFAADYSNRSDSDNGLYLKSVKKAVYSYKHFTRFKRDSIYRQILEHVDEDTGRQYLEIARNRTPEIFDICLHTVLQSDNIGHPVKYACGDFGLLSPNTLRYVKVASDLYILFDMDIGSRIAEIGCGYGGQVIVLDTVFEFEMYHAYDLILVNRLIEKYLESFVMRGAYQTKNAKHVVW